MLIVRLFCANQPITLVIYLFIYLPDYRAHICVNLHKIVAFFERTDIQAALLGACRLLVQAQLPGCLMNMDTLQFLFIATQINHQPIRSRIGIHLQPGRYQITGWVRPTIPAYLGE